MPINWAGGCCKSFSPAEFTKRSRLAGSNAKIGICPIKSGSGTRLKVLEYLASGKAVVATDLPGTESILGSESGALLVPIEQFVDSLKIVLKDDEQRRRLGSKCREYSETNFSIESVSKMFEDVLSEAANIQVPT